MVVAVGDLRDSRNDGLCVGEGRMRLPGSASLRAGVAAFVLAGLSACATLPAPEATAFHKLATADRDAFDGLIGRESAALSELAIRRVGAGEGTIRTQHCGPDDSADCRLDYALDGTAIVLGAAAPHTRALIGATARYGGQMADLAEARDIQELDDKARAAGGAVRGLIAVVLPGSDAITTPIVDAAVLALHGKLVAKRRRLLLVNAEAAKPAIDTAAARMTEIAGLAKQNILIASAASIRRAQRALGDLHLPDPPGANDPLRGERTDAAATLIRAGRDLNGARLLATDFSALARAHDALIAKLRDPKASLDGADAYLDDFLAVLDDVAAIAKE